MAAVGPGRASIEGLKWLAEVGPSPLGAWGVAMGWGRGATYSHAARLRAQGWLTGCDRRLGEGSMVWATRNGVRCYATTAKAINKQPDPHTWPHLEACAWTAAWLTVRGREMIAPDDSSTTTVGKGRSAGVSATRSAGADTAQTSPAGYQTAAGCPWKSSSATIHEHDSTPSSTSTPTGSVGDTARRWSTSAQTST